MDSETKEIVTEQKKIKELVSGEAWGIVRAKLIEKIGDLQNAFNADDSDPQKLIIDIKARKFATDVLFDWLKDVEGTAEQHNTNSLTLNKSNYIVREDLM